MPRAMRVIAFGVLLGTLFAGAPGSVATADPADPVLPLPPPPTLPATTAPAALEPFLVVTGPTVGAVCGTASLLALLAPSLVQGFFKIPLDQLVSGHTLTQYTDTALYVCGFVPSPLTPTECANDVAIVDALRGVNPLIAQVIGLFPEGASIDTVLDVEKLLPSSTPIAQPVVDQLAALMHCARAGGVPPVQKSTRMALTPLSVAPPPPQAAETPASPGGAASPSGTEPVAEGVPGRGVGTATGAAIPGSPITLLETRFLNRHGTQWLALVIGLLLLCAAAGAWIWARGEEHG
jgi:hypothetical protein